MKNKVLIPCIYLKHGKAVEGFGKTKIFEDGDAVALAEKYGKMGRTNFWYLICHLMIRNMMRLWAVLRKLYRRQRFL